MPNLILCERIKTVNILRELVSTFFRTFLRGRGKGGKVDSSLGYTERHS